MKNKNYNLGGPLDPPVKTLNRPYKKRESYYINPTKPLLEYHPPKFIDPMNVYEGFNEIVNKQALANLTPLPTDANVKSKSRNRFREKGLGGLTTNESNLIEALIKNLDKPTANFSNQLSMGGKPPKYYLDYNS